LLGVYRKDLDVLDIRPELEQMARKEPQQYLDALNAQNIDFNLLLELAREQKIITFRQGKYTLDTGGGHEINLGSAKQNVEGWLRDNPHTWEDLANRVGLAKYASLLGGVEEKGKSAPSDEKSVEELKAEKERLERELQAMRETKQEKAGKAEEAVTVDGAQYKWSVNNDNELTVVRLSDNKKLDKRSKEYKAVQDNLKANEKL
jgi:hypothetical protein